MLKVGTFNIRNSGANDGGNAWPNRRPLLIQSVLRFGPDIVGFQEVLPDQQADLTIGLPDYASVATFRDDGKTCGEAASIFFRRDRFDLLDHGTFWLSQTPDVPGSFGWDAVCTRICTWATLTDKVAGKTVLTANTHFDHEGVEARVKSAQLIARRLAAIANGGAMVLIGDFNAVETGPVYAALLAAIKAERLSLFDVYRAVHPQRQPGETSVHWFGDQAVEERIDWIFCNDELSAVDATIDRTNSPDGRYPSDHFPIWATLQYTR